MALLPLAPLRRTQGMAVAKAQIEAKRSSVAIKQSKTTQDLEMWPGLGTKKTVWLGKRERINLKPPVFLVWGFLFSPDLEQLVVFKVHEMVVAMQGDCEGGRGWLLALMHSKAPKQHSTLPLLAVVGSWLVKICQHVCLR